MGLLDNNLETQLEDKIFEKSITNLMRNYLIEKSGNAMFHDDMQFKIVPEFEHNIYKIKRRKRYSFYYNFIYRNEDGMMGELIGIRLHLFSNSDFRSRLYFPLNVTLCEFLNDLKHESIG